MTFSLSVLLFLSLVSLESEIQIKCQEASKSVNPTAEGEGASEAPTPPSGNEQAEKIFLSVLELAAPVWTPGLTKK